MPETIPTDTTLETFHVQIAVLRRMDPSRRLELACQLSDYARELSASGVRQRHPDYSDEQVRLAVIRLSLGEKLFREVYPGVDIRP
jgi:hypothetical protein